MLKQLIQDLNKTKDPNKAKLYQLYFKTGKGQYAEGDKFLGITVPKQRLIAKKYYDLPFSDISKLLASNVHELRFTALVILVKEYQVANKDSKKEIFDFYIKNSKCVNNWDLVDTSAPYIVGDWLTGRNKLILYEMAKSKNIWEKRIAVLSTFAFIKNGEFEDALKISKLLINDKHDLIHKAVGWMLREVGKKDFNIEEDFLNKHYKLMPRTMLRYAIEKFPKKKRNFYLK